MASEVTLSVIADTFRDRSGVGPAKLGMVESLVSSGRPMGRQAAGISCGALGTACGAPIDGLLDQLTEMH